MSKPIGIIKLVTFLLALEFSPKLGSAQTQLPIQYEVNPDVKELVERVKGNPSLTTQSSVDGSTSSFVLRYEKRKWDGGVEYRVIYTDRSYDFYGGAGETSDGIIGRNDILCIIISPIGKEGYFFIDKDLNGINSKEAEYARIPKEEGEGERFIIGQRINGKREFI